MRFPPRAWLAALWLVTCLAFAYLPDIGKGFIADDFSWIYFSRVSSVDDVLRPLWTTPMGFYRPIVSWSFALNHAVFGMSAMPYTLTNVALVLLTMFGCVSIGRRWGLSPMAALMAAAFWSLNFHGIGMALTWISGRTSLLASAFAVMAGLATTDRRPLLAGGLTLGALLSKEEPVLLPLILAAWIALDWRAAGNSWRGSAMRAVKSTWPSFLALAIYVGVRLNTVAFTPWDAPEEYVLSLSPRVVVPNVLEYADRSSTIVAAVLVLGWLLFSRQRFALEDGERHVVRKGLVWLVLGFGATVFVPTRSDLYACFPSIGGVLAGAAIASALWRAIPASRQRLAATALLVLPLLLLPVYRARNLLSREDARMSTRVLTEISSELYRHPEVTRVRVYERPGDRISVFSSFKGTLPRAIELVTGKKPTVDIEPITNKSAAESAISAETLSFEFISPP